MSQPHPSKTRPRHFLSYLGLLLLLIFLFLVILIYYFSSDSGALSIETFDWLMRLRDIALGAGIILLALGNFLRLTGGRWFLWLRWFWLILAVAFTLYWIFRRSGLQFNQLA